MSNDGPPQLRLEGFDDVVVEPDRDAWTTPLEITSIIGRYDLDPCSNQYSTVRADKTFDLARGQDGLVLAKFVSRGTKTWINPPYSRGQVIRWVRAYRHTRFTFLVRADVSTDWFEELWPFVEAVALPKQRVAFRPPPGIANPPGSPFPHVLLYAEARDITPEVRRDCYVLYREDISMRIRLGTNNELAVAALIDLIEGSEAPELDFETIERLAVKLMEKAQKLRRGP